MHTELVDPRDTLWETDWPVYRVVFWDENRASSEWNVVDANDFHEVWAWAQRQAHGRVVTIHLLVDNTHGLGQARLVGPVPGPTA